MAVMVVALIESCFMLATAAHGAVQCGRNHVQLCRLIGSVEVDLSHGFAIRESRFGPRTMVLKADGRRFRIYGSLGGGPRAVEVWVRRAADGQ